MKSILRRFDIPLLHPSRISLRALAAAIACLACTVSALDYPGCAAPKDADFTMTTIASQAANDLKEPLRMAFDLTAAGNVDVYFVEKGGRVRKYDGANKNVVTLGTIPVRAPAEQGLLGIALDPGFKANRRLYFYFTSKGAPDEYHLSRFTLAGETLDMASEKIVLHVPMTFPQWHTGGAIAFDAAGDLWLTTGENHAGDGGPSNTNDLRGKVLHIHPQDDGSYTIPNGNLYPPGTAKTRPEVFVMGTRNPYSITLDPKHPGWVAWGDVGPDGKGKTEDFNLATKPGNYGWPYFSGNNQVLVAGKVPSAPINNGAGNTGLQNLPPSTPATYFYQESAAISGPIYRYNAIPNSPVKMPPQFDGLWFVTDYNSYGVLGQTMDTVAVDEQGHINQLARIWPSWHLLHPTAFYVGPDGAIYAMNYGGYFNTTANTSIVRIEYHGTCRPAVDNSISIADRSGATGALLAVSGSRLTVHSQGDALLQVRDLSGKTVYSQRITGAGEFDLAPLVRGRSGLYAVTLEAGSFRETRKVLLSGL